MDPQASAVPGAAERILPDSRSRLPPAALDATAVMAVAGEAALLARLDVVTPSPAVIALSEDTALLRTVTQAVIERLAVITCASADRFVDQLVANGADLALIDADFAPNPIDVFLLAMRRQFPHLQMVVVGTAALHATLAGTLAAGTVFRFVPRPASAERLKTLLFAAIRQHGTALAGAQPGTTGQQTPEAALPRARPAWMWPAVLILTAAAAALIGWLASAWAERLP
jgi:hypothetical protein